MAQTCSLELSGYISSSLLSSNACDINRQDIEMHWYVWHIFYGLQIMVLQNV